MENKLILMTDFVIEQSKNEDGFYLCFTRCENYAEFLKQSLALWMFVPCDENNVPLEEPIYSITNYGASPEAFKRFEEDRKKFEQAKKRVLFEGFEIEQSKSRIGFYLPESNYIDYSIVQNNFSSPSKYLTTIEDLIIYSGLTLTETAIKSIYGS
ncbi:hypothetical protein [Elizabethkingia anophelis]|uniref:Uncharacterized protein n=1 Tax=Elizabethkingia anophelis TaxID=1117645 RepID=A0AAU8V6H8_9FLAO|nr:hypothetical protein [Elizabethkingia anophelis]AQX00453.1 hypothetical protein BBD32_02720 [Elizabethkingia anophelis]OPB66221.1 hypothetical protein BAY11_14750 [Elizabethkingia anophelis]